MIRSFLNRYSTRGSAATVLLVVLLSLSMSAQAQIPTSVLVARKDSLSVSGSVMYPPGSGQYIHYVLTHNTGAQTLDVQLNSTHYHNVFLTVLDTTYQTVSDTGTLHSGIFTRSVDISALNGASNYHMFYLYTPEEQNVLPALFTTLK